MRRRELARWFFAGLAVEIAPACRGSGVTAPGPSTADNEGAVGTNHGHRAVITSAQLAAGGALLLEIAGQSTHGHTLTLTSDEVKKIRAGERVSQFSSDGFDDKHDHLVTFNGSGSRSG